MSELQESMLVVMVLMLLGYLFCKFADWISLVPMLNNYTPRYILITRCDSGFGHAVSKRLALKGCQVFAACLTEQGKQALDAMALGNLKVQMLLQAFQMDVTDEASVEAGFQYVKRSLPPGGGLWGVVNNAGKPGLADPEEQLTKANYPSVLDVNLLGLIHVTTTFLPLVKKQQGRIVNVSSMLGRTTLMGSTPCCVSTYGVKTFSDSLRRQLKPFNVSVHLIETGYFRTSTARHTPETQWKYGEQFLEESIKFVIRGMVGGLVSDRVGFVHDAIEHALLGTFPRTHHVVGLGLLPTQWLPDCLRDSLREFVWDWLHEVMARGRPLPAAVS